MSEEINLNLACGRRPIEGYKGIDMVDNGDHQHYVGDVRKLDFPDNSIGKMISIHFIEHLLLWEVAPTLKEWLRCLKPGGELIVELPDAYICMLNVVSGHQDPYLGIIGIYGDPTEKREEMLHRWAWSPKTLTKMLESCGYVKIREEVAKYKRPIVRDFRLVAYKAEGE